MRGDESAEHWIEYFGVFVSVLCVPSSPFIFSDSILKKVGAVAELFGRQTTACELFVPAFCSLTAGSLTTLVPNCIASKAAAYLGVKVGRFACIK